MPTYNSTHRRSCGTCSLCYLTQEPRNLQVVELLTSCSLIRGFTIPLCSKVPVSMGMIGSGGLRCGLG